MKLKALILSMDGVLADTHEFGHLEAFNLTFKNEGLDWYWNNKIYQNLLNIAGDREKIEYYMAKHKPSFKASKEFQTKDVFINHLYTIKQKYYLDAIRLGKLPLRAGVKRLLLDAKNQDVALAIATTTSYANVTSLLNVALGEEAITWFQAIGSYETLKNKKPAEDIYKWVLGELGCKPHECVAMEGSLIGIRSSTGAGIRTMCLVNKYTRKEDLLQADAAVSELCGENYKIKIFKGKRPKNNVVDIYFLENMIKQESNNITFPLSSMIVLIILLTLLGISLDLR